MLVVVTVVAVLVAAALIVALSPLVALFSLLVVLSCFVYNGSLTPGTFSGSEIFCSSSSYICRMQTK